QWNEFDEKSRDKEWNELDEGILRMLLPVCRRNVCQMKDILPNVHCQYTCDQVLFKVWSWLPSFRPLGTPDTCPVLPSASDPLSNSLTDKKATTKLRKKQPSSLFYSTYIYIYMHIYRHNKRFKKEKKHLINLSLVIMMVHVQKTIAYVFNAKTIVKNFAHVLKLVHKGKRKHHCLMWTLLDLFVCFACMALKKEPLSEAVSSSPDPSTNFHKDESHEQKRNFDLEMKDSSKEKQQSCWDKNLTVEIAGIPGIKPFILCDNVNCTQRAKKKLWIGKSRVHGFGCFAGELIKKDEFITEYLGEVITQDEADRRGKIYDKMNLSYLFDLNKECVIDAARKGCKIKFANHSSASANCHARIVKTNGEHRVCVYSKKDIQPGEELFFDYGHGSHKSAKPEWFEHD
ncbi:hypothetical protein RFI_08702, partial [Reticulomyxa filosa]